MWKEVNYNELEVNRMYRTKVINGSKSSNYTRLRFRGSGFVDMLGVKCVVDPTHVFVYQTNIK